MRDTGAPHQGRIYRWHAGRGVHVFAERAKEGGGTLSNYYDLSSPSITASGDLIAYNGRRDCRVGTFCVVNPQTAGVVQPVAGGALLFQDEGFVFLSRNGRYALLAGFLFGDVTWIDLATGQRRQTPRSSFQSHVGNRIADDGSYLVPSDSRGLILYTADAERTLATSPTAWTAAISADGATVVYESQPQAGLPRRVDSIDVASGRETLLLTSDEVARNAANISISNDGGRILLLASEAADRATQWIFLINADGSRPDWFTYINEGFREAILSGDGRVIFAVSNNNRLFRIDAESGGATELIHRSPFVATLAGAPLAGSTVRLQGGGFTWSECRAESYPLPESLCGIEVEFLGRRMAIERITPSEIRFQIPWDTPIPPVNIMPFEALPTDPIVVRRSGSSSFASPEYARARTALPAATGAGRSATCRWLRGNVQLRGREQGKP